MNVFPGDANRYRGLHLDVASSSSPSREAWRGSPPLARRLAVTLAMGLGVVLLAMFYAVVSHIVGHASHMREMARATAERQVVCSAFSSTSSRDLCLVTFASHRTANPIIHASDELPVWTAAKPELTARLD